MRKLPRILIVEDEPAIAELIAVNLRHHGMQPVCVEDGAAAQREFDQQIPHAIILDWMLPGQSGVDLARRWRSDEHKKHVPILMLTARGDESDKIKGLDAGVDDYLTKPFSVPELLARIRALLRRHGAPHVVLTSGRLSLDTTSHRVLWEGREIKIGPTEFKLLHHFMRYPERVYTRTQLLQHVWGDDALIEERSVDVHVKRLREALGAGAAMIQTVRGLGYRMAAQPTAVSNDSDGTSP